MSAAPIDLRGFEPPEPMERVLDALDFLLPAGALQVLLEREPFPLYRILARNRYAHSAVWQADGACLATITRGAPWFGALAGMLVAWHGGSVFASRWSGPAPSEGPGAFLKQFKAVNRGAGYSRRTGPAARHRGPATD